MKTPVLLLCEYHSKNGVKRRGQTRCAADIRAESEECEGELLVMHIFGSACALVNYLSDIRCESGKHDEESE